MSNKESRLAIVIDSRDAEVNLKRLRKSLSGLSDDAKNHEKSVDGIAGAYKDANGRLRDANGKFIKMGDNVGKTTKSMDKLKESFNGAVKVAVAGVATIGVGIAGFAVSAVRTAGDFESAMKGVQAVSGAVGDDFTKLRDTAKELGATTAYSATEAGKGMEFLAMAGMNTEQVLSTIPNALSLASAGGIELAQSADILSNIMTGLGIKAEESGKVADILAEASAGANVNIGMLGESMKHAAPIAKQLGMSLEDTAGMVGILGNAGIQGSEAGTALRAIYSRFATDKKALGHFESLGISVRDSNGKLKGMVDVLTELSTATANLDPADKMKIFKESVGAEAMSALGVSVDAIADGSLPKLIERLEGAKGSAKKMADIRMEGLNGSIKGLKSAWEGFQIVAAEEGLLSGASTGIKMLTDVIRDITLNLPIASQALKDFASNADLAGKWEALKGAIQSVGDTLAPVTEFFRENDKLAEALAISIGIVGGAFLIYNGVIAIATGVTGAFTAVLAVLTSPVTLIIGALVALTAAGVYLYQNWDMVKAKATEVFNALPAPIQQAVENIKSIYDGLVSFVSSAIELLAPVVKAQFALHVGIITTTFQVIKGVISTSWQVIKAVFTTNLSVIATIFNTGFALVKNTVSTALNAIKALARGDIKGFVSIIGSGIKNAISIVVSGMSGIVRAFGTLGTKLYTIGSQAVQGLISGIKNKISGAISVARDLASSVSDTVKNFFVIKSPSRLFKKFGGYLATGLAIGIKGKESEAVKAALSMAQNVSGAMSTLTKDIELFGNNSPLASFDYDVKGGMYEGIKQSVIDSYRELIKQKQILVDTAKAEKLAQDTLKNNFKAEMQYKQSANDDFYNMTDRMQPNDPFARLQETFDRRLEMIRQFEATHTGIKAEADNARLTATKHYNAGIRRLEEERVSTTMDGLTSLFGVIIGEQSSAFKTMFRATQLYNFYTAQTDSFAAIAKAWNSAPFPANLGIVAATTMQTGIIPAAIKAISPQGFKSGGYTGNGGIDDIAGVTHGQEYVVKARSTKKYRRELEQMNRGTYKEGGGTNVTINNYSSAEVVERKNPDGSVTIEVVDRMIKRAFSNLSRPNSHESKQVTRNTTARVNRAS